MHADFGALPVVEIAEDIDVRSAGQPLAQPPSVERIVPLPAEITISVGVVRDRTGGPFDLGKTVGIAFVTTVHFILDGMQPLVAFDDRKSACLFHKYKVLRFSERRLRIRPSSLDITNITFFFEYRPEQRFFAVSDAFSARIIC